MSIINLIIVLVLTVFTSGINIMRSDQKMKLDSSESFEVRSGCREIVVPNNYNKLILGFKFKNVDRAVITDYRIDTCEETKELSKCCARNSTFCVENINPDQNDFRLNYCSESTYIYACIIKNESEKLRILQTNDTITNHSDINTLMTNETSVKNVTDTDINLKENITINNANDNDNKENLTIKDNNLTDNYTDSTLKEATIFIKSSIIKGQGCQSTEFISETECSSIGLISCKDPQKCLNKCSYVECRTILNDPQSKVFAMCLPSELAEGDIINRCRNHVEFEKPDQSRPEIYKKICERKEEDYVPSTNSHFLFKCILVVFGVMLLATFIASVYYRFKVSMDGVPPFEPPAFVPNFIFPRSYPYY